LRTDLYLRVMAMLVLAAPVGLAAQQMPPPVSEVPMLDPYVPPSARPKNLRVPIATEGSELQAQVERKQRARFDAASGGSATITRAQAIAGGLGSIAANFEAIDTARRGAVTFEEYRAYLRKR